MQNTKIQDLLEYSIVNINKPQGPTSHQVSDFIKRIFEIEKAGHSGTLDPNVTGVLPIALGRATRIVQVLLKAGKEYTGLMRIHKDTDEAKINEAVKIFVGKIKQLPPVRSAVKRQFREREVYELEILEISGKNVLFRIRCEAGFYVRKFCYEFGKALGTQANMFQLVRTRVGAFTDRNWVTLHDLKDAYEFYKEGDESRLRQILMPIETAVEHVPKVWADDKFVKGLCHGIDLYIDGTAKNTPFKKDETVAVMASNNKLICLGTARINSDDIKTSGQRDKVVKVKKVFTNKNRE